MKQLELLAPARDIRIGIAAIDCGADAVYIAGPQFGARQAAGNPVEDIRSLCEYAHKFGAKIFVTLNTILYEAELEGAYKFMLDIQKAGADAIIVQDLAVLEMARYGLNGTFEPLNMPLHASTQCAIRTPEQARYLESLGFSRLILERELSLEQIRSIREAVSCELEFFVHGALCVCYSGQCYLSELIAGRSANRGSCIQACRSRYDLVDASGKVLVRDKALLSLKDYNLRGRLRELAEAGITSFKIEGRLKNESYVRNVVRDYSLALDRLVEKGGYERLSFGNVTGGFTPDTSKTFNRGYTELFLDGKRGKWAAMDAAKSMGELIGTVSAVGRDSVQVNLKNGVVLNNADGFSFVSRHGKVEGFRGDVCTGSTIKCKVLPSLYVGVQLYRNINAAFEKDVERNQCSREIPVDVVFSFSFDGSIWTLAVTAESQDGRRVVLSVDAGNQIAENTERMKGMLHNQIEKCTGHYRFHLADVRYMENLPFLRASELNDVRRRLAEQLDATPVCSKALLLRNPDQVSPLPFPAESASYKQNISNSLSETVYVNTGVKSVGKAYELEHTPDAELMRTKYCIRYELGMCPVHQGAKNSVPLFLLNNGKRLAVKFDCRNCEMIISLQDGCTSHIGDALPK